MLPEDHFFLRNWLNFLLRCTLPGGIRESSSYLWKQIYSNSNLIYVYIVIISIEDNFYNYHMWHVLRNTTYIQLEKIHNSGKKLFWILIVHFSFMCYFEGIDNKLILKEISAETPNILWVVIILWRLQTSYAILRFFVCQQEWPDYLVNFFWILHFFSTFNRLSTLKDT